MKQTQDEDLKRMRLLHNAKKGVCLLRQAHHLPPPAPDGQAYTRGAQVKPSVPPNHSTTGPETGACGATCVLCTGLPGSQASAPWDCVQARLQSQSAPLCAVASTLWKRLPQLRRFIPGSVGPETSTEEQISPDCVARTRPPFPPRRGSPVQRASTTSKLSRITWGRFFHDLGHWLVRSVIALAALFSSMVCGTGTLRVRLCEVFRDPLRNQHPTRDDEKDLLRLVKNLAQGCPRASTENSKRASSMSSRNSRVVDATVASRSLLLCWTMHPY